MPTTFPLAWLLLGLPFASAALIASIPPLLRLAERWPAVTLAVGVAGVSVFFLALLGMLPLSITVAAMIGGAAFGGFSCFWGHGTDRQDGGDDWRRPPPGDDEPPEPPGDHPPIDWGEFDRLRAQWGRPRPAPDRCPAPTR